jgi:hypothetical protein
VYHHSITSHQTRHRSCEASRADQLSPAARGAPILVGQHCRNAAVLFCTSFCSPPFCYHLPPFHFVAPSYLASCSYPSLLQLPCIRPHAVPHHCHDCRPHLPHFPSSSEPSPLYLCTPLKTLATTWTLTHHKRGQMAAHKSQGERKQQGREARRPGARGTHQGGPKVSDDWFRW